MSIVSDSSVNKSVRSHFSRPYSPRERIRYELGIVDGETGFDRYFQGNEWVSQSFIHGSNLCQ